MSAFLRFEQLAAYSRAVLGGSDESGRILGITRVRRALAQGKSVPIGVGGDESVCFRLNEHHRLEAVAMARLATLRKDELLYHAVCVKRVVA